VSRMRQFIQTPIQIDAQPKFEHYTLADGLYIIASIGGAWLTKFLVHPILSMVYLVVVPLTVCVLFWPVSGMSANKKVYQVMMIVLFRDRGVYRSIDVTGSSETDVKESG
jgi:hypothetical protein